jgi:hypothetical protein
MNQSDPTEGMQGRKEMSTRAATLVADTPTWIAHSISEDIARVPAHALRPPEERRAYSRAKLSLALRVRRIAGRRENQIEPLHTANISSSGVLFPCPRLIEPGTPVEIEISLLDRPLGRGSVKMLTEAHIVRVDAASRPGWHMLAVAFDDITFKREEPMPSRFERH